jgi:DNA-binding NarL/FixJ family response regulator
MPDRPSTWAHARFAWLFQEAGRDRCSCKLAPESKIIFVTQGSSPEVVEAALSLGALGYVVKTRAAGDLLAAVEAVLEGRQCVSDGVDTSSRPDY